MSESHGEIIIIKRKGGHGAAHHGGAWKIAFADFMTAMMAFFLVLWIINATDKDTKTIISRYFNPVKLENPARARKGVHGYDSNANVSDDNAGEQTTAQQAAADNPNKDDKAAGPAAAPSVGTPPKKDEKPKTPAAAAHPEPANAVDVKPTMSETALFSDPYKSLDKIAGAKEVDTPAPAPDTGSGEASREAGSASIEAFRDPFKPVGPGAAADSATMQADALPPPSPHQIPDVEPQKGEVADVGPAKRVELTAPTPTPTSGLASGPPSAAASTAAQVEKELQAKLGGLAKSDASPALEVRVTDGGLLISLTDRMSFSMFAVGSAEPRPELLKSMEAIADALKKRPGRIVVRGHTDARPFKGGTYDNWRLSSARAQMAYYMLTRAGLPESRIDRVEGYADHALRDATHPLAAENRRIEILLREAKP